MRMRSSLVIFSGLAALAIACANGLAAEDDGGLPIEEEDASTAPPTTGRDSSTPTPPQRDAAPPSDDGGTGAEVGPTLDGGTGDGSTGTDSGTSGACTSPNTCIGGIMMTGVSGDTGNDTSTQTGATSRWLKIRVSEDNNLGVKLKLKLTLTSPPGTNFDLRVYLADDGSSQKCTVPDRTTTTTTSADVTSLEWGEGFIPNASADDRTVSIEVVHVSGTCVTNQNWTLLAEGNKL